MHKVLRTDCYFLPDEMATHRKICFSFPSVLTQDLGGEKVDEEISLEDTLATDMSIIAPVSVCFFIIHSFFIHSSFVSVIVVSVISTGNYPRPWITSE